MNLIPVNYDNDKQTVNARDLHDFLAIDSNYTTWFKRMTEYGFAEGTDFVPFLEESTGGRPSENHQITIEMAKEIAMIQRSEKGKQARLYFIEIEKRWNSPEAVMARALKMADKKILEYQNQVIEMLPKVDAYENFIGKEHLYTISVVAKKLAIPNLGEKNLFTYLRGRNILSSTKSHWNEPYQEYVDQGYFTLRDGKPWTLNGKEIIKQQTFVTPKGVEFISRMLNKDGYIHLAKSDLVLMYY